MRLQVNACVGGTVTTLLLWFLCHSLDRVCVIEFSSYQKRMREATKIDAKKMQQINWTHTVQQLLTDKVIRIVLALRRLLFLFFFALAHSTHLIIVYLLLTSKRQIKWNDGEKKSAQRLTQGTRYTLWTDDECRWWRKKNKKSVEWRKKERIKILFELFA